MKPSFKRPYLTKPLTHKGQLLRVRSHLEMQSRWKTCPQFPQAMLKPSSEAADGFAWYSMLGSWRLLRHIAHVSVHIDHDQTATAFHWDKCNINDTNVDEPSLSYSHLFHLKASCWWQTHSASTSRGQNRSELHSQRSVAKEVRRYLRKTRTFVIRRYLLRSGVT